MRCNLFFRGLLDYGIAAGAVLCGWASFAHADYSARDFFMAAPAATFHTEVDMTEPEKALIIKNKFQPLADSDYSKCLDWGVPEESPHTMELKSCFDSSIRIRVFNSIPGPIVVAVCVSMGQSSELDMYTVSLSEHTITNIPRDQLASIGIEKITENDFLSEESKFSESEALPAEIFMVHDGSIQAMVSSWMDPRWENKIITYDVSFVWDGVKFKKVRTKREALPDRH